MFFRAPFERDRFTWLAYSMAAFFAYLQASLGPLMPFLRDELGIGYTVAGLHFSAFALGMILAGLVSSRVSRMWGYGTALWGGAVGMAIGVLMLALSHRVALTIGSVLLMGLLGSILKNTVQANVSNRHPENRTAVLTEMSAAANVSAGCVPLLIGGFARTGLGWRAALFLAAIAPVLLFLQYRRFHIPTPPSSQDEANASPPRLPLPFWFYWATLFSGVSIGYCLSYWGADFLETEVGLAKSDAASTMSVFLFAGMIGRLAGSRLSAKIASECLVVGAIAITTVGFLLFWLAPFPWLNVLGLLIAGLGAANFYPLLLSTAVGTAHRQSNQATARLSIGAGAAILISPFLLGWIADHLALKQAFGLVVVLLVAITGLLLVARHLKKKAERSQAQEA